MTKNIRIKFLLLFLLILMINSKTAYAEKINILNSNLIIYSEKVVSKESGVSVFENKVLLIFQDFTLECDYLFVDSKRGYIKAKGNIRAINNEIEILCSEVEIDTFLESVKIKKAEVSLSDNIKFTAKEIFALKKFINMDGFKFANDDFKIPIDYSILIDKIKVLPILNGQYFFTQVKDVNTGIFNFDNLSPIPVPFYSFYIKNPLIPKNYNYQRRIRGFYDIGSYFFRGGFDGYSGLWSNFTFSYLSSKNSNGFFTAQYGTFSNLDLSIYHDLTDNQDNLIQFSGLYYNYDRNLKRNLFSGTLNFTHDWKDEILNLRFSLNQKNNETLINRLPEIALNSLYRYEPVTQIQYKYGIEAARFFITEKDKKQDIGKLELNLNLNTKRYAVDFFKNKFYLQGLTEVNSLYYFNNGNQNAFSWQLEAESKIYDKFTYLLRYRQRNVFAKNPVSFENMANYSVFVLQLNYFFNDFINFSVSNEFSIIDKKFNDLFLLVNYESKYYDIDLLLEISPYQIQNSSIRSNFKINNF